MTERRRSWWGGCCAAAVAAAQVMGGCGQAVAEGDGGAARPEAPPIESAAEPEAADDPEPAVPILARLTIDKTEAKIGEEITLRLPYEDYSSYLLYDPIGRGDVPTFDWVVEHDDEVERIRPGESMWPRLASSAPELIVPLREPDPTKGAVGVTLALTRPGTYTFHLRDFTYPRTPSDPPGRTITVTNAVTVTVAEPPEGVEEGVRLLALEQTSFPEVERPGEQLMYARFRVHYRVLASGIKQVLEVMEVISSQPSGPVPELEVGKVMGLADLAAYPNRPPQAKRNP